ncbi:MAG: O-antigen ligase family protein, partial [Planctomycetota bacterium]|nr:O-antigen ligase family protein [Planctomycetota bacterium]
TWLAAALAIGTAAVAVRALLAEPTVSPFSLGLSLFPIVGLLALAALQCWGGTALVVSDGSHGAPDTVYPAATRLAVASLLTAAAAATIGAIVFSREPAFEGLLAACLVSAATVAFLGIAMRLTGDDRVIRGMTFVGDPFARFVNRNNACAYLCVGLAAGIALLRSTFRLHEIDERDGLSHQNSWRMDRTTRTLVIVTLLAICLAGAIASRSRGGTIAAFVTLFTGLAFFRGERWGRRLLLLLPLVGTAAALVAWVGLSGPVLDRFGSLSAEAVFREGRIPHWQDAMEAVKARPLFGAGLGTYGYAHQEFSKQPQAEWYEHADNHFVETLVEGGAAGALFIVAIAILTLISLVRGRERPVAGALIASLVAGQASHAFFDYGIIIPAVTLSVAMLWGAGTVRLLTNLDDSTFRSAWFSRAAVVGISVSISAGLIWAYGEHRSAAAVERYSGVASRADRPGGLDAAEVDRAIAGLSQALERRSDDAVGQRELARLYVYRYRSAATAAMQSIDASLTKDAAWRATSLVSLHRAVTRLTAAGALTGVASLRQDPLAQRDLVPARAHLLAAEAACPRLPGVHVPLAALSFLNPEVNPGGVDELKAAVRLFPTDADML